MRKSVFNCSMHSTGSRAQSGGFSNDFVRLQRTASIDRSVLSNAIETLRQQRSAVSSSIAGSQFAAIQGYEEEKQHVNPGDAMIEAIAEAVATKLSRMATMSHRLMDVEEPRGT